MSRFTVRGLRRADCFPGWVTIRWSRLPTSVGEAHWDPAIPSRLAALRFAPHRSAVQNDISDKDRREMERVMHEEVLETDKYAEIAFESTAAAANSSGRWKSTATCRCTE